MSFQEIPLIPSSLLARSPRSVHSFNPKATRMTEPQGQFLSCGCVHPEFWRLLPFQPPALHFWIILDAILRQIVCESSRLPLVRMSPRQAGVIACKCRYIHAPDTLENFQPFTSPSLPSPGVNSPTAVQIQPDFHMRSG
jgi:hypothetical protein